MAGVMKLSIKEATELANLIEEDGGNASSLRAAISNITKKSVGLQTIAANEISDEEYIEALREQSPIEHGDGLECMVCHDKFDQLVSGTCEACFRQWALSTKKR